MVNQKIKIVLTLFFVTVSACCLRADIAERINKIINDPKQKAVEFSIDIKRADSGEILYRHNARKAMIPASNMKLITTAAAVKVLGKDFEYVTKVGLDDHTLVVIGSGDPMIGETQICQRNQKDRLWIISDIIKKLKENNINQVNDIIIDTTVFDDIRVHPSWPADQLNRYYACEVSGFNIHENCIDVKVTNKQGRIYIDVQPRTNYMKIINKVRPIRKGRGAVGALRTASENQIIINGRCRKSQGPFKVAIERPAAFFGFVLAERLAQNAIATDGQLVEASFAITDSFKIIAEYKTPLSDCLSICNKDSFGMAAEALMKTLSAKSYSLHRYGNWEHGQQVIANYLAGIGIDPCEFVIDDGSGLSRKNRLSANAITTVLHDIYKSDAWNIYKPSLAIGGIDGTIARYFRENPYKGRIIGKTGYIRGVKSFSGICNTEKGDYLFSILSNQANGRTRGTLNDIAKAVVDWGQER